MLLSRAAEAQEDHQLLCKKHVDSRRDISCVLWNPCSLQSKLEDFLALLQDRDLDIAAVTETWLTTQYSNLTAELSERGYSIYHFHRESKRGGGVALI